MPTPKKTAPERELRRLAIAGRWDDVRELLLTRIAQDATDTDAKEELQRLEEGRPLKAMMNAAQRRAAAAEETDAAIHAFMAATPLPELKKLSKTELPDFCKEWDTLCDAYRRYHKKLTQSMLAYRAELKSRRSKYRGFLFKKVVKVGGIAATLAVAVFGVNHFLKAGAIKECELFEAALNGKNIQQVLELQDKVNSSINRFYCPELPDLLHRAEIWLFELQKERRSVEDDIARIEKGRISVAEMGLKGQMQLESRLRALMLGKDELTKRWQELCRKEQHALKEQREQVLKSVYAPLPAFPECTGVPQTDEELLAQYCSIIEKRHEEAQLADAAYNITKSTLGAMEEAYLQAKQHRQEIRDYKRILDKLPKCSNYQEYCELLQAFSPQAYPPATALAAIKSELPTQEDIAHRVMDPTGNFSPELLAAARKTLVEKAPTFMPGYPATHEQVVLMEDIFTASSLRHKVYGIILEDGSMWFSTKKPFVDKTNFLIFQRSTIDPNYSIEHNRLELQNDGRAKIVEYDASDLLKVGDFAKNTFFNTAHLTTLLTKVLNMPEQKTPALARACVYYTLLRLAHEHRHMLLTGARFSPTLKEHAASFTQLMKKQGIELQPGCWLSGAAEVKAAEKAYAAWFREHRGADYAREAADKFNERFNVSSRYSGYINHKHEYVARKHTSDAAYLWFIGDDGMQRTPVQDADFSEAHPWSPVFTEKRTQNSD